MTVVLRSGRDRGVMSRVKNALKMPAGRIWFSPEGRVLLQIELLGGFEARLAPDSGLVFGQRKAQAILAYLALAPDYTVPRARLVHLLWSERGEEQARSSLRQALAALRKGLREAAPGESEAPEAPDAPEALVSGRETVALAAEQVDIDPSASRAWRSPAILPIYRPPMRFIAAICSTASRLPSCRFRNGWNASASACAKWPAACCNPWPRSMRT